MPAMVEKMMFVGAAPWHGEGTQLDENPSISEAITAAGLDWESINLCKRFGEDAKHSF